MTIAFIIICVITAVLAAISVRLWLDNREWSDLAAEIQSENEALRKDNAVLCGEKLQLSKEIDGVTLTLSTIRNQLDDTFEELENLRAERNELLAARLETVSSPAAPSLLPVGHTNTYRCEDYRLFVKNSQQERLQRQCKTDRTTGIRYFVKDGQEFFCAAMGGAYGVEIGRSYMVELRNGYIFDVIVSDFKHPIDNPRANDYGDPDTNYDGAQCTNVIEFVVDMDIIPETVRLSGTMSALEQFGGLYGDGGDIVEMKKLERVWKP